MKAVFDTKPTSVYDDDISQHYHFPRRYLELVSKCVGDWIVLRRPRADGGNLAYFATAKVVSVSPDTKQRSMSYANLAGFLAFPEQVPWRRNGSYAEQALRDLPPPKVGVYLRGRSVRLLTEADFTGIIAAALASTFTPDAAERLDISAAALAEASAALRPPPAGERNWRIEQALMSRIVRDASFKSDVYEAYENRCAVTGLRIIDGKGNSEVHAAHIWAVASGGPDVVQNGIALSATIHWLFDRYLISLADDYTLLISDRLRRPECQTLLASFGEKIRLPIYSKDWPHPFYLTKHRKKFEEANNLSAIDAGSVEI
jgi:putative restriction endonuclease